MTNLITHTPLKHIKSKTGNKQFLFLFISTELQLLKQNAHGY